MSVGKLDVYGRFIELGSPLSAEAIRMLIDTDDGTIEGQRQELMIQQMELSYQQAVNRLYDIGSPLTYLYVGRTAGEMRIGKIVGNRGFYDSFIRKYGNACNVQNSITLTAFTGCNQAEARRQGAIVLDGNIVQSIAMRINAQEMIINEGVTVMTLRVSKYGAVRASS